MKKTILFLALSCASAFAFAGKTVTTTTVIGKNNGTIVSNPPGGGTVTSINCDNTYPMECYKQTVETENSKQVAVGDPITIQLYNQNGAPTQTVKGFFQSKTVTNLSQTITNTVITMSNQ